MLAIIGGHSCLVPDFYRNSIVNPPFNTIVAIGFCYVRKLPLVPSIPRTFISISGGLRVPVNNTLSVPHLESGTFSEHKNQTEADQNTSLIGKTNWTRWHRRCGFRWLPNSSPGK